MDRQFSRDNKNFDFVFELILILYLKLFILVSLRNIDKETLSVLKFKKCRNNMVLVEAKVFYFFVAAQFKLFF